MRGLRPVRLREPPTLRRGTIGASDPVTSDPVTLAISACSRVTAVSDNPNSAQTFASSRPVRATPISSIEPDHLPPLLSRLSCYLVILPQGCHFHDDPWGESGHHSAFSFHAAGWVDKPDVRFAWVGQDGTINKTMETIVHELVEAFNDAAGLEIGGRCQAGNKKANPKNDGFFATVGGVSYRSYWSNFHNRCIAPPSPDPTTQQVAVE